jgi:hypothetical protein
LHKGLYLQNQCQLRERASLDQVNYFFPQKPPGGLRPGFLPARVSGFFVIAGYPFKLPRFFEEVQKYLTLRCRLEMCDGFLN